MSLRALIAVCAAGLSLVLASPGRADPPTIADFVEPGVISHASLSPSGRYLVWVRRAGDASIVQIRDLETDKVEHMIAGSASEHFGGVYVRWVHWKTDDRLIVGQTRLEVRRRGNRETGAVAGWTYGESVISVGRDGSGMIALRAPRTDDALPGDLLDTLDDDPDHILMTYRNGFGSLDVARVNVVTGEAEKVLGGHSRILDYIVDRDGDVVGRIAYRGLTGRVILMEALNADGQWSEVYRLRRDEVRELPDYRVLGPTTEPGKIYVAIQPEAAEGESTAGVHIFDFKTRTMGPTVWRNAQYDVSGIVLDADTSELLGGCYWADIYRCDFEDRSHQAVINGIRRFLGESWSVSVVSQARDGSRWLVLASAPNNPGVYYLFNTAERRMEPLGELYPLLPEEYLGETRRVDYQAGDGLALFGYLTRPPGAPADARPPLVVMPHGGPEMRDTLSYDMWVQFLATRGYQVFQPNFRGSSGMGKAFTQAGHGQWGARMQTDVSDGVAHLAAQGLVDPAQVCIMGASYGGYAALVGAATQADTYKCAISVAGPSDLNAMLRHERAEGGADSDRYEYWVRSIGDPRTDRERIEAASPLVRVADWRTPVLLIHGDEDEVVPIAQSRNLERALRRAGKDVRLVVLDDADHNGWSTAQETTVLTEMEAFLARHLPATPYSPTGAPAAP